MSGAKHFSSTGAVDEKHAPTAAERGRRNRVDSGLDSTLDSALRAR
jgi:hypothetical protein